MIGMGSRGSGREEVGTVNIDNSLNFALKGSKDRV